MQIYVNKIKPNTEDKEIDFIETQVHFWEDESTPCRSAEVTVFIKKASLSLVEIETQAIKEARQFLKLAAEFYPS